MEETKLQCLLELNRYAQSALKMWALKQELELLQRANAQDNGIEIETNHPIFSQEEFDNTIACAEIMVRKLKE